MGSNRKPRAKRACLITAEDRESPRSGTVVANYRDTPSCERICGWGGARNRADRASEALSDGQVIKLIAAAKFALATGRVFQRHWTVHYGKAGIGAAEGATFVRHLLKQVGQQARREGGALTAIWVRERASNKGEHVHILMHLPAAMRLHGRTRRWIENAGGTWQPGVSKVRIVAGRLNKIGGNNDPTWIENAANVVDYLLKAASEQTGEKLRLKRAGRGGQIVGKRCGATQNLGPSGRSSRSR